MGREARANKERSWPVDRFKVTRPDGEEVVEAAGFALGQVGELAFFDDRKKTFRVFNNSQWLTIDRLPDIAIES